MRCKSILLLVSVVVLVVPLIEIPPVSAAVETPKGGKADNSWIPTGPYNPWAKGFAVAITLYTPVETGVARFTKIGCSVVLGDPIDFWYPYVKKMWVRVTPAGESYSYYWPHTGTIVDNTGTGGECGPGWEIVLGIVVDILIEGTKVVLDMHEEPPSKEWKGAEIDGAHWIEAIVREDTYDTDNRLQTMAANFDSVFEQDGPNKLIVEAGCDIGVFTPSPYGPVKSGAYYSYNLAFTTEVINVGGGVIKVLAVQNGTSLTTGDVYIDGQWSGLTGSTFTVESGTHTVRTNDFWEVGGTGYRYGFTNWDDGSTDKERSVTVEEDKTLTAYFNKVHCPGDCNGDSVVNELDGDILQAAYFSSRGGLNWNSQADLNGDGRVDGIDGALLDYDYCLLTVLAEDQYGERTGDVYIDDQWRGLTGSTFNVVAGTRKVFVSPGLFQYWVEDGSTENPRIMWLVEGATTITAHFYNLPPNTPWISGPTLGLTGSSYTYYTRTTDPDGDKVRYVFDWGDGSINVTGYYESGVTISTSHSWSSPGKYNVRVSAQDVYGGDSGWSIIAVKIGEFVSPTGYEDPSGWWVDEEKAYDDNRETCAYVSPITPGGWSGELILTLPSAITSEMIRFSAWYEPSLLHQIDIDVYKDGVWVDVYQGIYLDKTWLFIPFHEGTVSKARIRIYCVSGYLTFRQLYEFDFWQV